MRLAVHNVAQLDDAEVRHRFVVRGHELEELLAHLGEDDPPRHALVIGPRGMGKSLLLRRVSIRVDDDADLAARWLPVLLPEEAYEVTSIGELWLAALHQVATALDDSNLAAQHRALLSEPDPSRLEALALERLLGAGRATGRKVLLLAENVDMLLTDQVGPDDGWALRQALQNESDLLFMATAVTTFAQVEEAGEALYGFFHRIDLRPLDDADVRTLWRDVTGVDLAVGRAAPIRILTGGNPRLVTVLGRFSQDPELSHLREDLDLLIDEYTPYFKANIESLPAVERKVFVTLADIWAPATAAEVAERARMTSSQVSALLGRLVRRGAVEVVEGEPGRKRYELTERLYNLYHLLRRPDGEGRVRAMVDILTHLYDPTDLERDVLPGLVRPGLGMSPSYLDTRIASRLERHIDEEGVWEDMTAEECEERLPTLESLLESQRASLGDAHPDTMLTRQQIAFFVGRSGNLAEALRLYREVVVDQERELGPDDPDTLTSRHQVAYCTGDIGDPRGALDLYRQLVDDRERVLGPDHRSTLRSRVGLAYYTGETGDPRAAVELYRRVAADSERVLGPDHRVTLTSRHQVAYYTGETGDAHTALELYRRVAADCERVLGPADRDTLVSRHGVAYYTAQMGDTRAALEIAADVVRRAEGNLDDDDFLRAARWLRGYLQMQVEAGSGRPLPRELREVRRLMEPRQDPPDSAVP